MFNLQNVTLLQPEEVLAPRLPNGSDDLAAYLGSVREALGSYYASTTAPGSRTLFIAVGPRAKCQFWLSGAALLSGEQAAVEALAHETTPPEVQIGPVVLALVYTVGGQSSVVEELTTPPQWQTVIQEAGRSLTIDDVIEVLWGDAS